MALARPAFFRAWRSADGTRIPSPPSGGGSLAMAVFANRQGILRSDAAALRLANRRPPVRFRRRLHHRVLADVRRVSEVKRGDRAAAIPPTSAAGRCADRAWAPSTLPHTASSPPRPSPL